MSRRIRLRMWSFFDRRPRGRRSGARESVAGRRSCHRRTDALTRFHYAMRCVNLCIIPARALGPVFDSLSLRKLNEKSCLTNFR